MVLKKEEKESSQLVNDKEIYDQLVKDLLQRESVLMAELKRRENQSKELETRIQRAIQSNSEGSVNTLSDGFELGKLPWPVNKGYISEPFGTHKHEDLKNIQTQNNGINIVCTNNSKVYPVFEGTVSAVLQVPGMLNSVLVKHGSHYTVYANLVTVSCVSGQQVDPQIELGQSRQKFRRYNRNSFRNLEREFKA